MLGFKPHLGSLIFLQRGHYIWSHITIPWNWQDKKPVMLIFKGEDHFLGEGI